MISRAASRRPLIPWLRRPVRAVERDVRDLHRTEYEGESAATPFIAVLGVFLFFATIFALILASSLIAYYLAV